MTTEISHTLTPTASAAYGQDSRTEVVEGERARELLDTLTAPLIETTPERAAQITAILRANGSTATDAQNTRVLKILRLGPVTAQELRRYADVVHAPARVLQLKELGHQIVGDWVRQVSELGHSHRTKRYTLISEAQAAEVVS